MALGLALGAAAVLGTSLLGATEGCAGKAPAPSSQPPVVVGVSFGLTGGLEAFAAPLRNAVRVAESQINAAGGVLGRPIAFDIVDDKSDEADFVASVASDFVAKKVVAVIGPIGSEQVVKTQKILADAHIVQISPSATSTTLTDIQSTDDRWLFRTTPADDFQGAAVMLFAQKTPNGLGKDAGASGGTSAEGGAPSSCTKLAIVDIDNAYGNAMAKVIVDNFPKKGGTIVVRKSVAVELAATYQDIAAQITALSPECLALIAYDDVAAQFVRDFKADPKYTTLAQNGFFFIGTDGVYTDGFLERGRSNPSDPTSPNVAEGVFGTNPDTQPGTPEYNQFKTIYASYFPLKELPDAPAFTANTYDAAMLIALAIQQAGSLDGTAIRDALLAVANPPGKPVTPAGLLDAFQLIQSGNDVDYKGASGAVDLEPNGNVKSGFIVWEAYRDPTKKTLAYRTRAHFALDELVDELK